jgi:hypothetical protein
LRRVTELPSFAGCPELTHVHLETMKGLTDLSPLLTASALTDLTVADMGHLKPADVTVLRSHPTLRRLGVGLGSIRKNNEVKNVMGLQETDYLYRHPSLDPGVA